MEDLCIFLILLAGPQNIPHGFYEAIEVDGGGTWATFRYVTMPRLLPFAFVAVIFRLVQASAIFDLVWVLTGGGPGSATETALICTYQTYVRYLDFGYGSAIECGNCIILALIAAFFYRLMVTRYEELFLAVRCSMLCCGAGSHGVARHHPLKTPDGLIAIPPTYVPHDPTTANYVQLFQRRPFLRYYLNSVTIAATSSLVCTVLLSLAAYLLARTLWDIALRRALDFAGCCILSTNYILVPSVRTHP
jgi:ABC-type sugar transport system permease subunit